MKFNIKIQENTCQCQVGEFKLFQIMRNELEFICIKTLYVSYIRQKEIQNNLKSILSNVTGR